jgi:integrase/recombinase XerD
MSNEYSSVLALYIAGLVATKRAAGYFYETAEVYLHDFDRYCSLHAEYSSLSKELVLAWVKYKTGEIPRTHRTRISPIRELGKYMQSIGVSDAYVLATGLSPKVERYVPYFFTSQELAAFFLTCDGLTPHGAMHVRHLVFPVFFRLLYGCGLRTCEARKLRVEDVDLQNGQLDILRSKGRRSRRLPLSKDILELLGTYDARVSEIYSDRIHFFPTTRSEGYQCSNISVVFRKIWKAAGLEDVSGKKPRAYDFRHHFALSNLNRWVASGVDVNSRLPYLSRYMGHSCLESTDYYLHLVPEFFHTFCEKMRPTETLLPELDYENE